MNHLEFAKAAYDELANEYEATFSRLACVSQVKANRKTIKLLKREGAIADAKRIGPLACLGIGVFEITWNVVELDRLIK
ncbi:MAG: hypothetical protein AAF810_05415 [Cyanobacteria bacterium P01_D01_bin.36]